MRKRERKLLFVYTNVFLQGNQAIEEHEYKVNLILKLEALFGDFARQINNNIEAFAWKNGQAIVVLNTIQGTTRQINIGESESSNDKQI